MLPPVLLLPAWSPDASSNRSFKVVCEGEAQTIALLRAGLTRDGETEGRLAALTAIRRVAEKNGPGAIKLLQASLWDKA